MHTGGLKKRHSGKVLCVGSRDLGSVFTQRREGGAGRQHKNACVKAGALQRRNVLHNSNFVGPGHSRGGSRFSVFALGPAPLSQGASLQEREAAAFFTTTPPLPAKVKRHGPTKTITA